VSRIEATPKRGVGRMVPSEQREVGDGVELAQVGTGDHEEVANIMSLHQSAARSERQSNQVEGAAAGRAR